MKTSIAGNNQVADDWFLDLDDEVAKFVRTYIDSFLKWDIVILFYHNSGLRDTASRIAEDLGREVKDVTKSLEELVKRGILAREEYKPETMYSLNAKKLEEIGKFVDSLESRENRLAILVRILHQEGEGA